MNPTDQTPQPSPAQTPPSNPVQSPPVQPAGPVVHNPLSVMQENEVVVCEIKRHPIGLLGVHIMTGVVLIVLAVIIYGVLPNVLTTVATGTIVALGTVVFVVIAALAFAFLAVSHKVYWSNRWILTSDSLTQISQFNLFDKQSSQLSLGNLEDVTAEQNGMLSHMFNFGALRVETAGERSKFTFPYCPNPTGYAQKILQAREAFEQGRRGGDDQRPYRGQDSYEQPTSNTISS